MSKSYQQQGRKRGAYRPRKNIPNLSFHPDTCGILPQYFRFTIDTTLTQEMDRFLTYCRDRSIVVVYDTVQGIGFGCMGNTPKWFRDVVKAGIRCGYRVTGEEGMVKLPDIATLESE